MKFRLPNTEGSPSLVTFTRWLTRSKYNPSHSQLNGHTSLNILGRYGSTQEGCSEDISRGNPLFHPDLVCYSLHDRNYAVMKRAARALKIVSIVIVIISSKFNNHFLVRFSLKDLEKAYEKTEDDIKAVQSVGQIIGEVMKQLDSDRCMCEEFIYRILG